MSQVQDATSLPSEPQRRTFYCCDCGDELTTDKERSLRVDPYNEEIHNKVIKGRWCHKYFQESCDEI